PARPRRLPAAPARPRRHHAGGRRRAAGQRHGDCLTDGRQVRRDLEELDPHPIGYPYPLPRPQPRNGRPSAGHSRMRGGLVTTPLPEPVPDTTTPELDALETETRTLIDRHLDAARDVAATTVASPVEVTRRNTRLVDRLRQARAAIIDTAMGAVRRAVPLGARDAAREAPPPAGTEVRYVPDDVDVHRVTGDIDLR